MYIGTFGKVYFLKFILWSLNGPTTHPKRIKLDLNRGRQRISALYVQCSN